MPDHIHVIVSLTNMDAPTFVGATLAVDPNNKVVEDNSIGQAQVMFQQPTIGAIIGAYKSILLNEGLKIYKSKIQSIGKFWQRNYYEYIFRGYESYVDISNYIIDNPKRWNDKQ